MVEWAINCCSRRSLPKEGKAMPIRTLSRLLTSRHPWIQGTLAALLIGSMTDLRGEECAPPLDEAPRRGTSLMRPLAACAPKRCVRREGSPEAEVFSEELTAAISAAVAQAIAEQQAQAASGAPGSAGATGAPAQFQAPAPSGQIAGASNSVGLRGLEIHFPELRFALPTLQLPSLVKFRREPHMQLDSAMAPMIAPASAAPAAPAGYYPQGVGAGSYGYAPYGTAPATTAPAGATPASAGGASPAAASGAPAKSTAAGSACRPKTRVRRVGPPKQRFWSDEEEWEVVQEVPGEDCAPEYESASAGHSSRAAGYAPARSHGGDGYEAIPKAPAADAGGYPVEPYDLPPEPGASRTPRRAPDELQSARAELAAARRQLAEVTKLLAAAGVDAAPGGVSPGGASLGGGTAARATAASGTAVPAGAGRRTSKAQTVQRLFQELEAPAQPPEEEPAERVAEETTDAPATTQTRRSPSAVRPAGHETAPASSRKSASTAPRRVASPATGVSQARGKGSFGPGHAVGR
jgi:hypothetical protein